MRMLATVAATLIVALPATTAPAPPVEVMVLGSYHFANAGADMFNVAADDVLAPRRQAELDEVVAALAAWKPDRVVVERQRPAPFVVEQFRDFTPAALASQRNEIVQIGFRLAHRLGHADVYGFDEQPGDGEPDYFPFEPVAAFAASHGMQPDLDALMATFAERTEAQSRAQQTESVAGLLLFENDPVRNAADHARGYYGLLRFGDADSQPGAVLNGMWYLRNAKMFAKLGLIAKPGERVVVLVGSGHKYWLDHFAATTPGFRRIDPRPFLERAARRSVRRTSP
jgi:Family of unknown function (DUF5694)